MIKVILKTRYAGPRGNFGPGESIEVDKEEADTLIAAGSAELVAAPVVAVERSLPRETATDKQTAKREKAKE